MASALPAVGEAVYGVLQGEDATFAALSSSWGGWHDDVPQAVTFPFGWFELLSSEQARGLGTGNLPLIELRLHVFSEFAGGAEARAIVDAAIDLFEDVALTVTGFRFCGHTFYDRTVTLSDEVINGVKCRELVAMFRLYVEE